jgi:hypothetical protein
VPPGTAFARSPRYVIEAPTNSEGDDMTGRMTLRQIASTAGSQSAPRELMIDELQQVIGAVRDVSTGMASGKRVHVPYMTTAT